MKSRRLLIVQSALVIVAAVLSIKAEPAYAAEGWSKDRGSWNYLDPRDNPVKNTWEQSRDGWYYLGPDAEILRNTFIDQNDALYYVGDDGKRLENQWFLVKAKTAAGQEPGWYYFGSNGRAAKAGTSQVKTIIGKKAYVFGEDGRMLTGWIDEDGHPVDRNANPLVDGVYYAGEDGALISNCWMDDSSMSPQDTGDLSSEITGKNYDDYDHIWLYFDSGYMRVRSENGKVKEKTIGGSTYGFDENGIMLPWWSQVASVSNADKSNPTSDKAPQYYSSYDGGRLLRNQWFYMYPSEDLSPDDSRNQKYSWWRTDEKGNIYQNQIRRINQQFYAFDGLGRMQSGFVLFQDKHKFLAQYDPDAWSADDFIEGKPYGIDRADLYFFSSDGLHDGSMKTGDAIRIELEDGVHTFGFKSNGEAYGDRNKIEKVKNSYYINGLRLEADEEFGYGVVETAPGGEDYRVVDTKGKEVTGQKRLLKDKDGGWIIILKNRFAGRVSDEEKPRWYNGPDGSGYYHYDSDDQEDPYAGGLIVDNDLGDVSFDALPDEEKLNF